MQTSARFGRHVAGPGLFLAAGLTAFILCGALPVSASNWRRLAAVSCVPMSGGSLSFDYLAAAIENYDSSATLGVMCPVPDDSTSSGDGTYPKSSITTLVADGYASSSTAVTIAPCATYAAGGTPGGTCDSATSTVTNSQYSRTVTLSTAWSAAGDFGYIWVTLPPTDPTNGNSTLRGIYLSNE